MKYLTAVAFLLIAGCDNLDNTFPSDIGRARNAVREKLRDPDSAKFKDLAACTDNSEIWAGEVNSKNGFGAYSGFEPFYVKRTIAAFYTDVSYDDFMRECYKGDAYMQNVLKDIPSDIERISGK